MEVDNDRRRGADGGADEPVALLMRHAEHSRGNLTTDGKSAVGRITGRLAEWCDGTYRHDDSITLAIWEMDSPEVRHTTEQLVDDLELSLAELADQHRALNHPKLEVRWKSRAGGERDGSPRPLVDDPRDIGPYRPNDAHVRGVLALLEKEFVAVAAGNNRAIVPVLVGNDPQLSWVATHLNGERRTAVAVDKGELVAFTSTPSATAGVIRKRPSRSRWHLTWNLSGATPQQVGQEREQITAKVKAKMDTATALGAVIVAVATFVVTDALRDAPHVWDWAALGALGAAASLYFAALFHFDTLQMPPRYWGSSARSRAHQRPWNRHVLRHPPSSTPRVLQWWMVRIWRRVFVPATVLLATGVLLLCAGAALDPSSSASAASQLLATAEARSAAPPSSDNDTKTVSEQVSLALAGGLIVAAAAWGWSQRPLLGACD